jgi:hypothetical protein
VRRFSKRHSGADAGWKAGGPARKKSDYVNIREYELEIRVFLCNN